MPCLALRGVSSAIARSRSLKAKVLLLNSMNDRETDGFTAMDYIRAIVTTLRNTDVPRDTQEPSAISPTEYPPSAFITHLVYMKGTMVSVDVKEIHAAGVKCVEIGTEEGAREDEPKFDAASVQEALTKILREDDTEP